MCYRTFREVSEGFREHYWLSNEFRRVNTLPEVSRYFKAFQEVSDGFQAILQVKAGKLQGDFRAIKTHGRFRTQGD